MGCELGWLKRTQTKISFWFEQPCMVPNASVFIITHPNRCKKRPFGWTVSKSNSNAGFNIYCSLANSLGDNGNGNFDLWLPCHSPLELHRWRADHQQGRPRGSGSRIYTIWVEKRNSPRNVAVRVNITLRLNHPHYWLCVEWVNFSNAPASLWILQYISCFVAEWTQNRPRL